MIGVPPFDGIVSNKLTGKFETWWMRWINQVQSILQSLQNYGVLQFEEPSNGFNIQISQGIGILILSPSGPLSTGAVSLPASPIDKQQIIISSTQEITSINIVSNSSISNQPGSIPAGNGVLYYYRSSDNTWYLLDSPGSSSSSTPPPPPPAPSSIEFRGLMFNASSSVSGADPGVGRMSWDNADITAVSSIYLSDSTNDLGSISVLLNELSDTGYVYIQQSDAPENWQIYKWSGAPTNLTGYFRLDVTFQAGTVTIGDGSIVYIVLAPYATDLTGRDFSNQGSTNTLLHGNASGNQSYGPVDLSADVSGNLPVTNLNSGTDAGINTFWNGTEAWVDALGDDLRSIKDLTEFGFAERFSDGEWHVHQLVGQTNRITIVDTAPGSDSQVVIDISADYIGQNSITTLGTITTGTWDATSISVAKGGTGLSSFTAGSLLYANTTTSLSEIPPGTLGLPLVSSGAGVGPAYSQIDLSTAATSSGNVSIPNGSVRITTQGKGLEIAEGSNARQGVATLVGGTITVNNTSITANTRVWLTIQSLGTVTVPTTVGVTAKTVGTSFVITSADPTDTSVIAWQLTEPA